MPVYMGCDITQDPLLSIEFSPTNPKNNTMAFLTGEGNDKFDYLFTRLYSKWLNNENVYIRGHDYVTINKTEEVFYQPWIEAIEVNGTDGNQFHPNLEDDEILTAFVSNFARSGTFTYKDSSWDTYPSDTNSAIEMMNFYLSDTIMQNKFKNPDN